MKKIVLIGGGGHAASVLDALIRRIEFEVVGIVDPSVRVGETLLGIPFLGGDEELPKIFNSGVKAATISVGSIENTDLRVKLYKMVKDIGFYLPVVRDPTAIVGCGSQISEGTFIGKGAIVNALSEIGKMAIINSNVVIEHECKIGEYCHIAPGSILGGKVNVGDYTHIGIGSVIIQGVNVGRYSLIGAGSVVIKDIAGHKIAYGNPCREKESI